MVAPGGETRRIAGADPAETEIAVSIKGASIVYPRSGQSAPVLAVEAISVEVRRGEKFLILGPSGCGKSTLLTAVAGFFPVSSGSIEVGAAPVGGPSMRRLMVFQDFGQLFPWRTVLGNIEWAVRRRWRSLSRREIRARAQHFVDLVGLHRQSGQYPNTLSGGQKQRCAIARAFAVSPEILLMDEPFGALDAINREKMQAELNRLWSGAEQKTTVMFVTHDVNEAVHLGHRIMVMSAGPGRLRALIDNPHVGAPPHDSSAVEIVSTLRELLKEVETPVRGAEAPEARSAA